MLGDVGEPELVGAVDGELAVDQVGIGVRGGVADGAAVASAPVEALDAGLAHQPGDPLVVDRQAEPQGQLGVDPRPAVGAAGLFVNLLDVFEQQLVLLDPGRLSLRR